MKNEKLKVEDKCANGGATWDIPMIIPGIPPHFSLFIFHFSF